MMLGLLMPARDLDHEHDRLYRMGITTYVIRMNAMVAYYASCVGHKTHRIEGGYACIVQHTAPIGSAQRDRFLQHPQAILLPVIHGQEPPGCKRTDACGSNSEPRKGIDSLHVTRTLPMPGLRGAHHLIRHFLPVKVQSARQVPGAHQRAATGQRPKPSMVIRVSPSRLSGPPFGRVPSRTVYADVDGALRARVRPARPPTAPLRGARPWRTEM